MKKNIYILGGGFGGLYSAMELEHGLAGDLESRSLWSTGITSFSSRQCCTRLPRAIWI